MSRPLDRFSRLVTARPWITIGVLILLTVVLAAGATRRAPPTEGTSLVVSILVVPPAMTIWGAYQNMRLRSQVQRMWDDLDVAAEGIHRRRTEGHGAS
jgi:hypothetical protein